MTGKLPKFPVQGNWAYNARAALKEAGCRWNAAYRVWDAPSAEVQQELIRLHGSAPVEWSATVHGDGGWKNGTGRWAYKARSHLPPLWLSGAFEGTCPDSMHAELWALQEGVKRVLAVWPPPETGGTLFIRSDCQGALTRIETWVKTLNLHSSIRVCIKHVPGHGKSANLRARWMNEQVDQASSMRGR